MFKRYIWCLIFILGLSGCISTNVNDSSDPAYTNFKVNKFLLITPTPELSQTFISELKSKDLSVQAVTKSTLFVATQRYTKDEMLEQMKNNAVNAILVIKMNLDGDVEQRVTTLGEARGSSFSVAYGDGVNEDTPVMTYSRDTISSAELIDPVSGVRVWSAQLNTSARGLFSVQKEETLESISEEVIQVLMDKGFFTKAN